MTAFQGPTQDGRPRMMLVEKVIDPMLIPALAGHEEKVAAHLRSRLAETDVATRSDRLGNPLTTSEGDPADSASSFDRSSWTA